MDNNDYDKFNTKLNLIIYILELEDNKFYVGKTNDVEKRFFEHANGNGSVWTKKYHVKKIKETIENADPFDEDKYVKKYMTMYGIDAVRGGSYSIIILTNEQINLLQSEINSALNLCNGCGKHGHFIKECKNFNMKEQFPCTFCGKCFDSVKGQKYHEEKWCKQKIHFWFYI